MILLLKDKQIKVLLDLIGWMDAGSKSRMTLKSEKWDWRDICYDAKKYTYKD